MTLDATAMINSHSTKYKPTSVESKIIPPTLDLFNLTIIDINPIDLGTDLVSLTRDNTQLLVNAIFALPSERLEGDSGSLVAKLPDLKSSIIPIPREKSIPKQKPKTKWEKFAQERGIQKVKKTKEVYDENSGTYLPRHGYKSAKNDPMNDWIKEVPLNGDPFDPESQPKKEGKGKKKIGKK